jgi:hypothetical protein
MGFLGSYHVDLNMDTLVTAVRNLFAVVTGHRPQFRAHGGSNAENLALQNIQVGVSKNTLSSTQHTCAATGLILYVGPIADGARLSFRTAFALGSWQGRGSACVRKRKC